MKQLIYSLFAVLMMMAPTHAADSHTLAVHGSWEVTVDYYESSDSLHCSMSSTGNRGVFLLSVDAYDEYRIFGLIDNVTSDYRYIDVELVIGRTTWTLGDFEVKPTDKPNQLYWSFVLGSGAKGYELREDIRRAHVMRFKINNGPDAKFSLRGSAAAMVALDRCRQKL